MAVIYCIVFDVPFLDFVDASILVYDLPCDRSCWIVPGAIDME